MTQDEKKEYFEWFKSVTTFRIEVHDHNPDFWWWVEDDYCIAHQINGEEFDFNPSMEFLIRDEMRKREWILSQQDEVQFHDEQLTFEVLYSCTISKVATNWTVVIGLADNEIYRLDALMLAFRRAVKSEGK